MDRRRTGSKAFPQTADSSSSCPAAGAQKRALAQGAALSVALVLPIVIVTLVALLLAPDGGVAAQGPRSAESVNEPGLPPDGIGAALQIGDGPVTIDCYPPAVELGKVASPSYRYEPGGTFVFTLTVTNKSEGPVKITSLTDSQAAKAVDYTQCAALIGTSLDPGKSASCVYSVVHANAGTYTNEASVSVKDDSGQCASDTAYASVKVKNVMPAITVVKTADPTEVPEPGGPVTFTVRVTNDSAGSDPVEIRSLVDSIHGDLNGKGTCAVGTVLQPGETYICTFSAEVSGSAGYSETDIVTVAAKDDDCNTVEASDDATVIITGGAIAPAITVVKTADPVEVPEPGGPVTFTVQVTNDSSVDDPVTITALVDDIHGNLNGQGTCGVGFTLQPGETYTCAFAGLVSGNAGYSETDTVTASGHDDEGTPVENSDDATVTVTGVAPAITVVKTADPVEVLAPGGPVTFTVQVTNDSVTTDPVTITSLTDDIHGDLNGQGTCGVGFTLQPGETYTCAFSAEVSGSAGYSETDTVTASGHDDEGTPVEDSDDATVTVTGVAPAITVVKTADPVEVLAPGGSVTFTVEVTNDSVTTDPVTITSLTDDIHGDLNGQGTCGVGFTLQPGETYSCAFTAPVSGNAGYSETDTVTASGVDDEGTPVEDSDTATVDVVSSNVRIVKTRTSASLVVVGDSVEFQIVVTNVGQVPLESVTVQDVYDTAYLTYSSFQATAEQQLTWSDLGPLAPGESVTITVEFTATASTQALEGKETINTATVIAVDESGNQHQDADSDTVGIYAPGVGIVKTPSEPVVRLNEPFTYSILVTNIGDYDLNPVVVTDVLPEGMTYVDGSAVPAPTTVSGQQLVWSDLTNGMPLAPGEQVQITLQVYISGEPGTYQNVASVDATHPRGTVTGTAPSPVDAESPRLAIDKDVAPPGNAVKGVISFTIEIRNVGSSVIDVLPLVDEWAGPTSYIGGAPTPNAIDNVGKTLHWDDLTAPAPYGFGSNLAPGEAFTVTVRFQLASFMATFSMRNTAIVDGARDIYGNPVDRVEDEISIYNVPTPISVMGFRASLDSAGVLIQWETFREDRNTLGFALLRSATGDLAGAQQVGFVAATELGTGVTSYSFLDQQVQPGTTYSYWLRIDYMAPELHSELYKDRATVTVPQVTLPYKFYLPIVFHNAN